MLKVNNNIISYECQQIMLYICSKHSPALYSLLLLILELEMGIKPNSNPHFGKNRTEPPKT